MINVKANQGWTLIELLTVVAIIGILSIGIMMAVSTQFGRARDATRIADLKDTQVYLERYYIDHDASYPNFAEANLDTNFDNMRDVLYGVYNEYDGNMADPKALHYTYHYGHPTTRGYCLCAEFERPEKTNSGPDCDFSAIDKTHYCLVNKQ